MIEEVLESSNDQNPNPAWETGTEKTENNASGTKLRLILTWAILLIASPIAIVVWRTFLTHEPFWWPWIHAIALLALLLLTLIHPVARSLGRFAAIMVVLFLMGYGGGWDWGLIPLIRSSELWNVWMATAPKALYEITLHLLRLTPAMIILAFLLITRRKRSEFYLVKGDINAIVEQSRLVSTKKPTQWIKIALIFSAVFVAVTIVFLIGAYGFPLTEFVQNWFFIPVSLLVAALNAFNEEFTLRAAPLGELKPVLGKSHSLVATAAYFGLGHYYGVPNGVIGVLLSGYLGWLLGKSMLETKGFFVAWLVHFLTDIPIFLFFIAGGI